MLEVSPPRIDGHSVRAGDKLVVEWTLTNNGFVEAPGTDFYVAKPTPIGRATYVGAEPPPDSVFEDDPDYYLTWSGLVLVAGESRVFKVTFLVGMGKATDLQFSASTSQGFSTDAYTDDLTSIEVTESKCQRSFTLRIGESCSIISEMYPSLAENDLESLNPGLDCSMPMSTKTAVCLAGVATFTDDSDEPITDPTFADDSCLASWQVGYTLHLLVVW